MVARAVSHKSYTPFGKWDYPFGPYDCCPRKLLTVHTAVNHVKKEGMKSENTEFYYTTTIFRFNTGSISIYADDILPTFFSS